MSCRLDFLCGALIILLATDSSAAQPLQWNVFFGEWLTAGPFLKSEDGEEGLATDYVGSETSLSPSRVDSRWKPERQQVLEFAQQPDVVWYALSSFESPRAQDAVLAVGSDDGFRVYLNGEVVLQEREISVPYLDHHRALVKLREGENVLLLKVENWVGPCAVQARLLPPYIDNPLLVVRHPDDAVWPLETVKLPDLEVDLLNSAGDLIARYRTSGSRFLVRKPYEGGTEIGWRLFAAAPDELPARVRIAAIRGEERMHAQEFPWSDTLNYGGGVSARVQVVEFDSQRPVPQAHLIDQRLRPETASADGVFVVNDLTLVGNRMSAFAPGYLPERFALDPMKEEKLIIALRRGGNVVQGQVVGPDGQPLEAVEIGILNGPWPRDIALTDQAGNFQLTGIDSEHKNLKILADHPEFAASTAIVKMMGATAWANFQLRPGATISGIAAPSHYELGPEPVSIFSPQLSDPRVLTGTHADATGRFLLTGVDAGLPIVLALRAGLEPIALRLATTAGAVTQLDVRLQAGRNITGRVVDERGRPLRGVIIDIGDWHGTDLLKRWLMTDAAGFFEISDMPASPVTIDLHKTDFERVTIPDAQAGDDLHVVIDRHSAD